MSTHSRYANSVKRKAERMARARRHPHSIFKYLLHVGVLSWMFVLPVVLSAFVGRQLAQWLGVPALALALLGVGLATGVGLVWRQLRSSLEDVEDGDALD